MFSVRPDISTFFFFFFLLTRILTTYQGDKVRDILICFVFWLFILCIAVTMSQHLNEVETSSFCSVIRNTPIKGW